MPNEKSNEPAGHPPAPVSKQPLSARSVAERQQAHRAALWRMNHPKPFTKEMMARVMKEMEEEALANASNTAVWFPVHD